jgi:hypothetical protein
VTLVEAPPRLSSALRVERWLLAPAPATRLAALRVLIGGYGVVHLLATAPSLLQIARLPASQLAPVGVLSWLPGPLPEAAVSVGLALAVVTGVAFVLGAGWRVSGPLFAVLFFLLSNYRVSWGHVSHADHLPALQLLVCGLVPAADAWALDRRRTRRGPRGRRGPREGRSSLGQVEPGSRYGAPVRIMALITVVTYVVAGLAKLRYGGIAWLDGEVLRNQVATDALQKTLLGAPHSPLGPWLAANGWLAVPASLAALAVELGAPVALLGGRWRDAWVASAWLFHVGIAATMAIAFPYPLSLVAFAPFYAVEVPVIRVAKLVQPRGT